MERIQTEDDSATVAVVAAKKQPSPRHTSIEVDPTETKRTRKRGREVSLEPGTPKDEQEAQDIRDRRAPAKKNRLESLDSAEDEEHSRSPPLVSHSPPLGTSPPEVSRLKQIRQRVEDLSWQDAQKSEQQQEAMMPQQQQHKLDHPSTTPLPPSAEDEHMISKGESNTVETVPEVRTSSPIVPEPVTPPMEPAVNSPSPLSNNKANGKVAPMECQDDPEKSLKRKALTRAASSSQLNLAPASKRPREDGSPSLEAGHLGIEPPDSGTKPASTPSKQQMGFLAFSSTASPFANVKSASSPFGNGPSPSTLFSSAPAKPTPPTKSSSWSNTFGGSTTITTTTPLSTLQPALTFPATTFAPSKPFGVPPSPSTLGRQKSPRPIKAFGAYSSASARFSAPSTKHRPKASSSVEGGTKRVRKTPKNNSDEGEKNGDLKNSDPGSGIDGDLDDAESPTQATFGDILRGAGDGDNSSDAEEEKPPKFQITETEVPTGEEDDTTVFQTRAKLHTMDDSKSQWRERGTGSIKVNVRKTDGAARLVMRAEGVFRLILNVSLFSGMHCVLGQDPKYLKLVAIADGKITQYALRVSNVKAAEDLLHHIRSHIPPKVAPSTPPPR